MRKKVTIEQIQVIDFGFGMAVMGFGSISDESPIALPDFSSPVLDLKPITKEDRLVSGPKRKVSSSKRKVKK